MTKEIKSTKYTTVVANDEKNKNSCAHNDYVIKSLNQNPPVTLQVVFQSGLPSEVGLNGVMNEDLLHMVIDRLQGFQESEFRCRENAVAITKLEEALRWLIKFS